MGTVRLSRVARETTRRFNVIAAHRTPSQAAQDGLLISGLEVRVLRGSPILSVHLYILRSKRTGRYYVGVTEDVAVRLAQHNQSDVNPSRWTRGGGPWELVFSRGYGSTREALRAERFVKRMKSRAFIDKLIRGEYQLPEFRD